MFSGLRQNSIFYILEKGEKPTLKVGQVATISNPMPKFGAVPYSTDTYVDVSVKVGEELMNFNQLPSALSIANFGSNMVVSESKEAMLSEVEGMRRVSQEVLNSIEYHRGVVEACESMQEILNPSVAKERATEQRIGAMEEKMGGIESTLTNIQDMLASALNRSQSKTK